MKRVTVLVLLSAAALAANPTIEYFLSEIQVAPDSLERIEIHWYTHDYNYPVDLSGMSIITRAGTAVIDSGIVLQDTDDFAVISRENTTGTFSLGDSADSIALVGGYDIEPYVYGDYGWTPPAGMSATVYAHWEGIWPDEYMVCEWYLDSTPTFGAPNDDRYGGIAGRVLDRFNRPLRWCLVWLRNANGSQYACCDTTGRYVLSPLGPGTYQVSARSDSTYLPAYYPDSVAIGVNGWCDSVNMTLYPVGVAGERTANRRPFLTQRGRNLILTADRPGKAHLIVRDNLGRECLRTEINLLSGSTEVPLANLRSGVYFASCGFWERTSTAKLVLY